MIRASKNAASGRAVTAIGFCALGCLGWVAAQEPARSERGGALAKAGRYQFEVFFYPTGLRVLPTDSAGAAVEASKLSGTATFYHPNSADPWFSRPLQAAAPGATSLDLSIHLTTVPPTGARVEFEIAGLPGAETPAAFVVPVVFVKTAAEAASSQPVAPRVPAAAQPTFVYGSGAAGYGYYAFPGPQAAPARSSAPTTLTTPARNTPGNRSSGSSSGGGTRRKSDWTTGRNLPMARPWLRPND